MSFENPSQQEPSVEPEAKLEEKEEEFSDYEIRSEGRLYGLSAETDREKIIDLMRAKQLVDDYKREMRSEVEKMKDKEPVERMREESRRELILNFELPENTTLDEARDVEKQWRSEIEQRREEQKKDPKGFSLGLQKHMLEMARRIREMKERK